MFSFKKCKVENCHTYALRDRDICFHHSLDKEAVIDNLIDDLKRIAPDVDSEKKICRMMDFSRDKLYDYVPDPYYSGAEGFELVLDLLEEACDGLLAYCRKSLK